MTDFQLVLHGDRAIDVGFTDPPSLLLSAKIHGLAEQVKQSLPDLQEAIPAYQHLTLIFDRPIHDPQAIKQQLTRAVRKWLTHLTSPDLADQPVHEIPVCYDDEFALDKAALLRHTGLSWQAIIERHSGRLYPIAMLGFSPGFMYLEGLDEQLYCPRKKNPATRIPAGSVGIGGQQTGIYPQATPGGWQILGRTPLPLFLPELTDPCPFKPLHRIGFVPIEPDEFRQIQLRLQQPNNRHFLVHHWREIVE